MFARKARPRRRWIRTGAVSSCGDWVRFDAGNARLYISTDELADLAGRVLNYRESVKGVDQC